MCYLCLLNNRSAVKHELGLSVSGCVGSWRYPIWLWRWLNWRTLVRRHPGACFAGAMVVGLLIARTTSR